MGSEQTQAAVGEVNVPGLAWRVIAGIIVLLVPLLSACELWQRGTFGTSEAVDGLTPLTISRASGGTARLQVEIADTPELMVRGLMERPSLPKDQGMLFAFAQVGRSPFWMKNTLVPLSIAFIDEGGTILHITDMEPQTETLHYSPTDYRYALEVNQGWFREQKVATGDQVHLRSDTLSIGNGR
jgi:uncharacterized membrane protein (UPF0127 family)